MPDLELGWPRNSGDGSPVDAHDICAMITDFIAEEELDCDMTCTLKSLPGSTHWHVKRNGCKGTLEITVWPVKMRLWASIRANRHGEWIKESLEGLQNAFPLVG